MPVLFLLASLLSSAQGIVDSCVLSRNQVLICPSVVVAAAIRQDGFDNPSTPPTPAETTRHMADTAFIYAAIAGGDLASTSFALSHNPKAVETNPLLRDADMALAIKLVVYSGACWMDYRLYQHNPKKARWVRRLIVVLGAGVIANNLYVAFE